VIDTVVAWVPEHPGVSRRSIAFGILPDPVALQDVLVFVFVQGDYAVVVFSVPADGIEDESVIADEPVIQRLPVDDVVRQNGDETRVRALRSCG
jgi:hypothetical protein